MSFLTPLYLLGALAVGLPVLFHMIRRTPRGRRDFSSVMFLEASPPRITRRSRIEHWLLLALRALAVCLLAIAFARPFLRTTEGQALTDGETRDFVVLLDTSASMRRETIWNEAVSRVEGLLDEMQPLDRVSLMSFDTQPRVLIDFNEWTSLELPERVAAAKTALQGLSPTWAATNLGRALINAAERLDSESTQDEIPRTRMIVLVSDMQEGSRLDDLQTYQWPPQVGVRLETVGIDASPNNAGLQPFAGRQAADSEDLRVRVRVANASNSRREQFTLRWEDEFTTASGTDDDNAEGPVVQGETSPVTVIVPPGQSRVITAPERSSESSADQMVLEGDDQDFDNRCFVPAPTQRTLTVAVVSDRNADDEQGMWYYVERAFVSTPERTVNVLSLDEIPTGDAASESPKLIILTATPTVERLEDVQDYLERGGTVLLVPTDAADVPLLYELVGIAPVEASEAIVESYSMLTDIDFTHPLFTSLDHPRYSDFSKVRFWKHRTIDPASLPDGRVLARFDDGAVAVGETRVGAGRLVYFTSGWHPEDSQLALSTKFVPMLNGLLDRAADIVEKREHYVVGDSVDLTSYDSGEGRVTGVRTPEGEQVAIESADQSFSQTDHPGRYRLEFENAPNDVDAAFVVNLDPAESRTARMPLQSLEAANVNLEATVQDPDESAHGERQLRGSELENQQKIWRWLIVLVIVLLLAETWLAGRTSRNPTTSPEAG